MNPKIEPQLSLAGLEVKPAREPQKEDQESITRKPQEFDGTKRCSKCKNKKPLNEFRINRGQPYCWCNECNNSERRRRYKEDCKNLEFREKQRARSSIYNPTVIKDGAYWERHKEYSRKNREKNKIQTHARSIVSRAIREGKLIPKPCEICGAKGEAHHEDYSLPLEIKWLCPVHHGLRHREIRDALINTTT